MQDQTSQNRIQEAERLIHEAIADVPLACSTPEAAAAVQALGLKLAETCMEPRAIAQTLLAQANGYIQAATDEQPQATAFAMLETVIDGMIAIGIEKGLAGKYMLTYIGLWLANADPAFAAETLYQMADSIVAKTAKAH